MANNRAYTKTGDVVHEMLDTTVYPRAFKSFHRRPKNDVKARTSFNPDLTEVLATGISGKKYGISERVVTNGKPHYVFKHTLSRDCWVRGRDTYRGQSELFPTLEQLVIYAFTDDKGLAKVYSVKASALNDYADDHKAEAKNVCYGGTLQDGSLYEEISLTFDILDVPTVQLLWQREDDERE